MFTCHLGRGLTLPGRAGHGDPRVECKWTGAEDMLLLNWRDSSRRHYETGKFHLRRWGDASEGHPAAGRFLPWSHQATAQKEQDMHGMQKQKAPDPKASFSRTPALEALGYSAWLPGGTRQRTDHL